MASSGSSQKFFRNNRAPRVQIEYEVEVGGAQKKIELPFVAGVLSDLSGKSTVEKKDMREREFVEFDNDNFTRRMKAIKPRVAFQVPNKLTGEGNLSVDLTFESMDDFAPDKIAQNDPTLQKLYARRQQLENLLSYMDGRPDAEKLLKRAMEDETFLKSLAEAPKPDDAGGA